MNIFYFGSPSPSLFGAYHPPSPNMDNQSGVLLCPPIGQSYIRSHRAFVNLANQLAKRGFHVLRFDYFATGDSLGDSLEGNLPRWREDIIQAGEELFDTADIKQLHLVGLRLGATLALQSIDGIQTPGKLILWDPVVDGNAYLQWLKTSQAQWQADLLYQPKAVEPDKHYFLGFPYSDALQQSIKEIRIEPKVPSSSSVLVLENDPEGSGNQLADQLNSTDISCRYQYLPGARIWKKESAFTSVLIPTGAINAITTYLGEKG